MHLTVRYADSVRHGYLPKHWLQTWQSLLPLHHCCAVLQANQSVAWSPCDVPPSGSLGLRTPNGESIFAWELGGKGGGALNVMRF